ncbi:alpha-2,8-polysialyltransferase family protein [Nocardiopsis sp. NPDC006139]|uniref:alpha-2,8-polysialyltransferase family protein n=1 Tax=Nocardiopsis sp. NPDC006139 TaxID=3154578 RepID=UPI0033B2E0AA
MTQIFVSSRLFGVMSLAAGIDSGVFGDDRRILLTVDNADIPEIATPLAETAGFAAVRDRFHQVISYNELIWPHHPSHWRAHRNDQPLIRRLLNSYLELGDGPLELVLEAIQGDPSRGLAELFENARLTVISDGLASYSPTRHVLPKQISGRLERLVHLDLVPGLAPLVLSEHGVERSIIDGKAFRAVMAEVTRSVPGLLTPLAAAEPAPPLLVGQYLASLDLLTSEEETDISLRALTACAGAGYRTVAFKPHPMNASGMVPAMRAQAERLGLELQVLESSLPVEAWFEVDPPSLVVGCFSTSLSTADKIYGIPVATIGTELVLERLTPYENSNRMPVTIADVTMPRLLDSGEVQAPLIAPERYAEDLGPLVRAVGYCMQAAAYPHLREEAAAYLRDYDGDLLRHFKRKRIAALGLTAPGVRPSAQPREASVPRRLARRARSLLRARPS